MGPWPLATGAPGPHHSSNPLADPELRPYTTQIQPVSWILRFMTNVRNFLPGFDWQMSTYITMLAWIPFLLNFSAFTVTSTSQSNFYESPATSLRPAGPKQSSWPDASPPPPDLRPRAEVHIRPDISEAKTETLLEIMSRFSLLPPRGFSSL